MNCEPLTDSDWKYFCELGWDAEDAAPHAAAVFGKTVRTLVHRLVELTNDPSLRVEFCHQATDLGLYHEVQRDTSCGRSFRELVINALTQGWPQLSLRTRIKAIETAMYLEDKSAICIDLTDNVMDILNGLRRAFREKKPIQSPSGLNEVDASIRYVLFHRPEGAITIDLKRLAPLVMEYIQDCPQEIRARWVSQLEAGPPLM